MSNPDLFSESNQPSALIKRAPPAIDLIAMTNDDSVQPLARRDAMHAYLHHHAHQYYVLDEPQIPDAEYDRVFKLLQALEAEHAELVTPDSPTERVLGAVMEGLASVTHAGGRLMVQRGH
jgi:NAD-dependent DNA ligase